MRKIILSISHTTLLLLFLIADFSCTKDVLEIQQPFIPADIKPPIFIPPITTPAIDTTLIVTPPLGSPPLVIPPLETPPSNPSPPPVIVPPAPPIITPPAPPVIIPPTPPVIIPPTPPVIIPPAPPVIIPPAPPVIIPPTPPVSQGGTIEIGTGGGPLILKNQTDKNFTIKPGTYSYFQFENLKNCVVSAINVKIEGGNVSLTTMNNVTLNGLTIANSSYRAFNFYKEANDLILKNITLNNIGDVAMVFQINRKYDGTTNSYSNNIQLINIKANNIGTFFASQGGHSNDGFSGLIKNFKMSGCSITNSPRLSNGVYIPAAEDYEISNNIINNVNSNQGDHNGIFHMIGNGEIFGNTCTNHQGNMVRAWLTSFTKPGNVEIYNNVVWNSTRYGAFELQVPPFLKALSSFKPATVARVYNNTAGKLNTGLPKYFEGRLLDLYDTYSQVEVYNNLLFNNVDDLILNKMSSDTFTKVTKNTNNIYKANANQAVADLISFRSLISGVGKQ